MASFNGHVCSLTLNGSTVSQTLGATATQTVNADPAVPHKWFNNGVMGVRLITGISGALSVDVYGSIGGATFKIGGVTAITAVGNWLIGMTSISAAGNGFPAPSKVIFGSADGVSGFTASVYLAGAY